MLRILAEMLSKCRKSVPWRDARSPHYPDPFLKHPPFHQVHFSSLPPTRFNRRAPYTAPAASSSDMPPSMGTVPSPSEGASWEKALRCNASRIIVMSFFIVLVFLVSSAGQRLGGSLRPPCPALGFFDVYSTTRRSVSFSCCCISLIRMMYVPRDSLRPCRNRYSPFTERCSSVFVSTNRPDISTTCTS